MLAIQKFLREGGTLESLYETYKIGSNRHADINNLILFKYTMIESPMGERIVQECRGIILDENDNWNVVARPFDKFFNMNEGHAAPIDWKTARVQEKVDGSLATIYVYDGRWHVATSGSAGASGKVLDYSPGAPDITFKELFWNTFWDYWQDNALLPPIDCNKTFFFELTSPMNRIVVRHKETSLTLLGGRDLTTQKELTPQEASVFLPYIPTVKEFPLTSFDECIATFEHMNPLAQEGYIVVDVDFHRVKVKHPGYVALHHLRDGLGSRRALIEIVRSGEITEVMSVFPEYAPVLTEAKTRLDTLVAVLEAAYEKHKDIVVQKDFALAIKDIPCYHALFALRSKRTASVRAYLRDMQIDSVLSLLKYKATDPTNK